MYSLCQQKKHTGRCDGRDLDNDDKKGFASTRGYSAFRIFSTALGDTEKICSFETRQSNLLRILAVSTNPSRLR